MTTLSGTSRYIFILVSLILILRHVATGPSKMKGVTVSYDSESRALQTQIRTSPGGVLYIRAPERVS